MRTQLLLSALLSVGQAIELDVSSPDSIKSAAKIVAKDLVAWYSGDQPGQSPGMLPDPYYWWNAGNEYTALICSLSELLTVRLRRCYVRLINRLLVLHWRRYLQ
jgi:hypothetical protein